MEIVLNSYGAKLSINNGAFMLNNSTGSHRIPVKDVDSILVAKSAVLTSDALILAIENDIRVTLADKGGNVMGCVWSHKYGSISTIRKGQLIFTASQDAVEWIKKVIIQKMQNQLALLLMLQVDTGQNELIVEEAGNKISKLIAKVDALEEFTVREIANNLRANEGNASKEYIRALNQFIPEKYRFKERSQHPATDVANAMLNYGYGILYGKIENALIRCGIDPYIGILHRDEYGRPVLSYDVIELYRVWIDYIVYSLLAQNIITEDYYTDERGAVWLEALGRRVIIQSVNDYLSENKSIKGMTRSRENPYISLYTKDTRNIQYGIKLMFRTHQLKAEINLFFGHKGYSVVESPKRGTSMQLNGMMAQLVNDYVQTLTYAS